MQIVCSEFVDELPELEEVYSTASTAKANTALVADTPRNLPADSPSDSIAVISTVSDDLTPWNVQSLYSGPQAATSPAKRRRTNDTDRQSAFDPDYGGLQYHARAQSFNGSSSVREEDAIDSLLRAADFSEQAVDSTENLLHHSSHDSGQSFTIQRQPDTPGVWPHTNIQEACLMRYFIDELACWVCSSRRHSDPVN